MNYKIINLCLLFCMGVSVSACMSDVKEVRELKPQSGSFNAELMTGYRELAIFEADEMYDGVLDNYEIS